MTLFNSLEQMVVQTAEGVRPPERLTVSQASAKYRYLNSPGAYVGPWLNETTPYLEEPMDSLNDDVKTGMAFVGPAQCGKALGLDTRIPTPSGWTTMGEISVGDWLIGGDGAPCRVTGVTPTQYGRDCYRMVFGNGQVVVAAADHNWVTREYRSTQNQKWTVQTTLDILNNRNKQNVPCGKQVRLPETDLPVDPYVFGAWLGDGHNAGARIYTHRDDASQMRENLRMETRYHEDKKGLGVIALSDERHNPGRAGGAHGVSAGLRSMNLSQGQNKYIPTVYLRSSVEQRMELLRGLLDTDGSADKRGRIEFTSSQPSLAEGFAELLLSLGYSFSRGSRQKSHRFSFSPKRDEILFRLPRKQERLHDCVRRPIRQEQTPISAIEPHESVPVRCITVDSPQRTYLFGEKWVVTHNTDMFLNWLTYTVVSDPVDMVLFEKTQATSRDFSIRRVDRLHDFTEEVGNRLVQGPKNDNTFDKKYTNGMLLTLSWPTKNTLSGKPVPRLWLSDYDRMDQDVEGDGSPFDLARKRMTTFRQFGMTAAESSPSFPIENARWVRKSRHEAPPTQGIISIYNRGDRRLWYWRCVQCHNAFEPSFKLMKWPKSEDRMESAEAAYIECPSCNAKYHQEEQDNPGKHEMNREHARWVKDGMIWTPDNTLVGEPFRSDISSFWLKGPAATFADFKTLVNNYLAAEEDYEKTGSEDSLKTTVNVDQGEPYIPKAQANARLPEMIKATARDYGLRMVPMGVRFLIATIDLQKNRFEVQVHGVGTDEHGLPDFWVIDRFKIQKSRRYDDDGDRAWVNLGAHPEDWKQLTDEVLMKTYPLLDGSGRHMSIKHTVSDSAGSENFTSNAYDFVRWLRQDPEHWSEDQDDTYVWKEGLAGRFSLLRGASTKNGPRVRLTYPDSERKDRNAGARGEIPVYEINTQNLKDNIDKMLDRKVPGGKVNFPDWLDDNFFTELTVEVKDPVKGWHNPKGFRNESWDLLVYAKAATLMAQVNVDNINWTNPPGWAKPWDENDLVFHPEMDDKPFEAKKPRANLAALAEKLA